MATIPGPLGLPRDTVRPEVSECSRMPASLRPLTSAATPCAPSWAIVTTCRVIRQAAGTATSSRAAAPVTSTAVAPGDGWVPTVSVQIRPRTS